MRCRDILLLSVMAGAFAAPAFGQTAGETAAPDFSGIWAHPFWPGFDPPLAGNPPVTNLSRARSGTGNSDQLVGDYNNPILKPEAAAVVKRLGEISKSGVTFPTPANQCWPEPVPYILWTIGIQLLQQKDKITILYSNPDQQYRVVRMNASHPANVTPSWYGDSVGHYEGDTLVVDTVGVKSTRPYAMADVYGTPYTDAIHIVERYRFVDYQAAVDAQTRTLKENISIPNNDAGLGFDPNYRGKALQLEFTVDDPGAYTMPWSASMTYRRATGSWPESVCAENTHEYYAGKESDVPHTDKPDF